MNHTGTPGRTRWEAAAVPISVARPRRGARRAWPDNESAHHLTQHRRRRRCGGRRRDRRARAGNTRTTSADRLEAAAGRLALAGLAAVPVGGGGAWPGFKTWARPRCRWAAAGPGRATHKRQAPTDRRPRGACGARPRCRWAVAGPGRASRSTTPSRQARVWRSRGRAAAHRHIQRPDPTIQATRRPEICRGSRNAASRRPPAHTAARPSKHNEAARPHRGRAAHASGR